MEADPDFISKITGFIESHTIGTVDDGVLYNKNAGFMIKRADDGLWDAIDTKSKQTMMRLSEEEMDVLAKDIALKPGRSGGIVNAIKSIFLPHVLLYLISRKKEIFLT